MENKSFIKYIFSLLLFGSNGIVAGFINLSSLQIVMLRTFIGGLLLVALFLLGGGKFSFYKHKKHFFYLAVSGAATGISWMFLYEAYVLLGVSVASLLYYCGPVIVMAVSPIAFGEKLTANKVLGFICVLIGVFLINGNAFDGGGRFLGVIFGILSALTYAVMIIFNKKASSIVGLENSALQIVISFLTIAFFVGIRQACSIHIPPQSILPLLVLGLANTGIGCFLYFSSIGKLNAQTVAVCGYLEPLSAVVYSALFLGERLLPLQWVGTALVLGGAMAGELFSLSGNLKNRLFPFKTKKNKTKI